MLSWDDFDEGNDKPARALPPVMKQDLLNAEIMISEAAPLRTVVPMTAPRSETVVAPVEQPPVSTTHELAVVRASETASETAARHSYERERLIRRR